MLAIAGLTLDCRFGGGFMPNLALQKKSKESVFWHCFHSAMPDTEGIKNTEGIQCTQTLICAALMPV